MDEQFLVKREARRPAGVNREVRTMGFGCRIVLRDQTGEEAKPALREKSLDCRSRPVHSARAAAQNQEGPGRHRPEHACRPAALLGGPWIWGQGLGGKVGAGMWATQSGAMAQVPC